MTKKKKILILVLVALAVLLGLLSIGSGVYTRPQYEAVINKPNIKTLPGPPEQNYDYINGRYQTKQGDDYYNR